MSCSSECNSGGIANAVYEVQICTTVDSEDVFDSMMFQSLGDRLGKFHLFAL